MGRRVSENTLLVRWDEKEQDFRVFYPHQCDGGFVIGHFFNRTISHPGYEETFVKELEKRGYDLKTLRFSIKKRT